MSGERLFLFMVSSDYVEVVSYEHIRDSAKKCLSGVTWKESVQNFHILSLQWTAELHKHLVEGTYKSKGFYKFWLMERGKRRFIQSVHISERCVQKCINNYGVKPIIEPRLIYDNGASRVGKGTDFAIKRLRQHLATHYRKHRKEGGILIMDFHDYFNSIPHKQLYKMLEYVIKDERLFNSVKYFIDCFGDKGLGLGSELSQICAVFFPNILDHYIKERLHIKGYARYMDDSYLIHENIDYLKYCKNKIETILKRMGLTLNPRTRIVKFKSGSFVFLKRRFFIEDSGKIVTRLLRVNITKRRRTLRKQKKQYDVGYVDINSVHQSYQSWRGYANKWNSYRTVRNMDKLYKELFYKEGNPHAHRKKRSARKTK